MSETSLTSSFSWLSFLWLLLKYTLSSSFLFRMFSEGSKHFLLNILGNIFTPVDISSLSSQMFFHMSDSSTTKNLIAIDAPQLPCPIWSHFFNRIAPFNISFAYKRGFLLLFSCKTYGLNVLKEFIAEEAWDCISPVWIIM